ncbi:BgtTE-56035 [Blumeria graminis f. sp. tritici]|uniref:BgtTE-56035 n=1 Tax=Blumeria graminis f. sp. tritici TaxID=62690 RepID=A0A9X9MER0_BLUGR|nr:BgtTE-56035 [Blumeria graminis f. sp. tritici]
MLLLLINLGLHHIQTGTWRAVKFYQNRKSDRWKISLQESPFLLHRNPTRAQSSLAIQIQSEHMGLNLYSHRRKVPGVYSPSCPCSYQSQNPKHMIMSCPRWSNGRAEIWRQAKDRSYEAMINNLEDIKRIIRWILNHGWIEQFQMTKAVEMLLRERNRSCLS